MPKPFAFYCKSYRGDLESFGALVRSFALHNEDELSLCVSVPTADQQAFRSVAGAYRNVDFVTDESYAERHFVAEPFWGISLGYLNQEVCKLAFWESGYADNYLCLDSDATFIRNFRLSDFMTREGAPYSVLTTDKDLLTDPAYDAFRTTRTAHVQRIFSTVGLDDPRHLTCHGMTIINSAVMSDFKSHFMGPRNWTYVDLLRIAPLEFTWYNAWLQKSQVIPVIAVEPFFKTFHTRQEYVFSRLRLIGRDDLARSYLGVVLNSNWARGAGAGVHRAGWKASLLNWMLTRWL